MYFLREDDGEEEINPEGLDMARLIWFKETGVDLYNYYVHYGHVGRMTISHM